MSRVTWRVKSTYTSRSVVLEVSGAPVMSNVPGISVQPYVLHLWVVDGRLTNIGYQGKQLTGKGSRGDTGDLASSFPADQAPPWMRDIAQEWLDGQQQ